MGDGESLGFDGQQRERKGKGLVKRDENIELTKKL